VVRLSAAGTVTTEADGSLHRVVIGRIASIALIVATLLLLAAELAVPGSFSRSSVLLVGGLTLIAGLASWWIPWARLPRRTVLWMVPFAFLTVDLGYIYSDRNGFNYGVTFVVIFVLVGLTQPRWTSVMMAPLLALAYLLPLLVVPSSLSTIGLGSALFVIPICLLLGETAAGERDRGDRRR
jgi:hypothetical protein